jgi:uncharacterized protein (DUF2062 family)
MPKKFIKRLTPDHDTIRNHKYMQLFGKLLHDPNLWHMNRRSVSGAFAAGLFWAMIPIPLQMVTAAATAIVFRVNLPISVALVWLTNPLTMPPIFYANYLVGTLLVSSHEKVEEFHLTMEWLSSSMNLIWEPLYVGSLVVAIVAAIAGYISIRVLWRLHIISRIRKKREEYLSRHR